MPPAAFAETKKFFGVVTVDFQTSAAASVIGWTGIKSGVLEVSLEQKEDVLEFEDGSENKTKKGWTGSAKLSIGQLDQTALTTLETYAPGTGTGEIDRVVVTFTERGTGSNYKVTITGLTSLKLNLASGDYWKQVIEFGITGAASLTLSDLVTIAHA